MRIAFVLPLLVACAHQPHAETFVKRNFGFAGPRELALVGPTSDVNALRLELQKRGFTVFEVDDLNSASSRYVANVGGACLGSYARSAAEDFSGGNASDAALHVFVLKAETRERMLSARLGDVEDCPDAFFAETAAAIARNWAREETAAADSR